MARIHAFDEIHWKTWQMLHDSMKIISESIATINLLQIELNKLGLILKVDSLCIAQYVRSLSLL